MRIGMLTDAYKPHISGVTNWIVLNKTYLESLGHEVHVFTFGGTHYTDTETNIHRAPGIPLTQSGFHLGLGYPRQMRKVLRTMDIVHVHHPFVSGSVALSLCKPRGIPIICTNHTRYDLYARVYLPILPPELSDALLSAYLPAFYRACDRVIAPSEGMRKVMVNMGIHSPIQVIPNGVDIAPFQRVSAPFDRSQWGFSDQDVILAFVGRVGKEKNTRFLMEAFAQTVQCAPQAALVMIGAGPELETLTDWVYDRGLGKRIHFTGFTPYDQIPRYLAAADAFVTASVTEVHPLTLIEALAVGLPLVGIESPGVSDIIEDGLTGLISPHDLTAFAHTIEQIVTDTALRQKLAAKARAAAQTYTIERTARQMLAEYQRLAAANPKAAA
jgi:glycosyltransferase involved in cell wall biosynthesis